MNTFRNRREGQADVESGQIQHRQEGLARSSLAEGSPSVTDRIGITRDLLVGWPTSGDFPVDGVLGERDCRAHDGKELLLWFEDSWMQDSDLGIPTGSLRKLLNSNRKGTASNRPQADCACEVAEQRVTFASSGSCNGWKKVHWLTRSGQGHRLQQTKQRSGQGEVLAEHDRSDQCATTGRSLKLVASLCNSIVVRSRM